MTDFPTHVEDGYPAIIYTGTTMAGESLAMTGASPNVSAVWPSANLAIFIPFVIYRPSIAYHLSLHNGAAVSGNVDMGIYDERGNRLVSKGSTAQAGTTTIQPFDITDTLLMPASYYVGLALDNGVGTVERSATQAVQQRVCGMQQMAAAFVLPATATFAALTNAYTPAVAVHLVSTV